MHQALQGVQRVDAVDGLFEEGNRQALQGVERVDALDGLFEEGNHQALQGVERVDALDGLFEEGNRQALQGEPRVGGIDEQINDREAVQGAACTMRAVGRCAATTRMTARRRGRGRKRRAAMTLEPKTFGAGERTLEGWCMEVGRRKVDQKQGYDPRWEVAREWGCEPMIERSWTVVRSSFLGNALSPC